MLAGLMVVILTVLDQPIHAECPGLPGDHPGHCTNKKTQVQSRLSLAGSLVSSFPSQYGERALRILLARLGLTGSPGARWLRNSEQGPRDWSSELSR